MNKALEHFVVDRLCHSPCPFAVIRLVSAFCTSQESTIVLITPRKKPIILRRPLSHLLDLELRARARVARPPICRVDHLLVLSHLLLGV